MSVSEVEVAMRNCSIVNGYAGLEEFRQLFFTHPPEAWGVVVRLLTTTYDPGRDDGALCFELLRLSSSCIGQSEVENFVLESWDSLTDEGRRNFIFGFVDDRVVSFDTAVKIFNRPSNSVTQRHLIVSALAMRRDVNWHFVTELARKIGEYSDRQRQAVLDEFIGALNRMT